jgi:hypothetical protein
VKQSWRKTIFQSAKKGGTKMSITPKVVVKAVNKDAEEAISRKILRLLVSAGIKTFKQTEVEIRNGLVDVHFNVLEKDLEKL